MDTDASNTNRSAEVDPLTMKAALVIGSSSDIATALIDALVSSGEISVLITVSRTPWQGGAIESNKVVHWHRVCDYSDAEIQSIVDQMPSEYAFRFVVICNGFLHSKVARQTQRELPEKRIEDIESDFFQASMKINALIPIMWIGKLTRRLSRQVKSEPVSIVVFSARVGSITDNQLGGWYSYRASKAALNMLLKTAAIELSRRVPQAKLISFHPGTTATQLSKPFQMNVPQEKLFSPDFVAQRLLEICLSHQPDGELSYLDWDNKSIDW